MGRQEMNESRKLLQHFLATLAYRTQKAVRGAPPDFGDFNAGRKTRTPLELMWHMTGLIGYARTMMRDGLFAPDRLPTFNAEVERFHATLSQLLHDFADESLTARITDQQFLQGPLADAMTHVGQLAMLRRLHGVPIASENFIFADIDADNVTSSQAEPAAPDLDWTPDRGHQPPGKGRIRVPGM
jgi:hypothetical protein